MMKVFGDFRFDDERRVLSAKGEPIRLTGQALDLLVLLLARPGELVTREELRRALWPDSHVEFDHSLDVVLSRVRSVLGDNSKTPRFVETVPRKGYRFIEPVRVETHAARKKAPRFWLRRVAAFTSVAILAALAGIVFAHTRY